VKKRLCCLAALWALALILPACTPAEVVPTPTPAPAVTPTSTPTPTPEPAEPTEAPFPVQAADVPPGDYAPWQESYAAFLAELRQTEGALKNWVNTASPDDLDKDPDRWAAYNDSSEEYSLYDVDKDGVPELFVKYGSDEASYRTVCYTYRDDQVTEIGGFPSGHSVLCTWPGENGVLLFRGHMEQASMEKFSLVDGVLADQGEIFSQVIDTIKQEEYTAPGELVPGSEYIPSYMTPTHWRPADSPALVLPIYDYGAPPWQNPAPAEEAEVRSALEKVLWENGPFYGVSGDGFYGDTGRTTLEEYLRPGGAYPYGDEPLAVANYAWADVNGDGQTDCVLRLVQDAETCFYAVLSLWDGEVYAYFFDFMGGVAVVPNGSVYFWQPWGADWSQVSFYKNQCCDYSAQEPEKWDGLVWEGFSPSRPFSALEP